MMAHAQGMGQLPILLLTTILVLGSCTINRLDTPGLVLPATVDENPSLPQANVRVAGKTRKIHLRTFGDSSNPALLFLHGSLGDHRAWLPYQALADKYFVILWDQRGNGLSERITAEEIGAEYVLDEINELKNRYSPTRKINLVGHSFGAMYTAYYVAKYGTMVNQAILIEPAGINSASMQEAMNRSFKLNLFSGSYASRVEASVNLGMQDHIRFDLAALQLLYSDEMQYHCDVNNKFELPVWRPGGYLDLVRGAQMVNSSGRFEFDYTQGLAAYADTVLLIGGTCSGIGYEYQQQIIAPFFQKTKVQRVENVGHRLIVEKPAHIISLLRSWLKETR